MPNCFVELKRWHNLLDDSINSENSPLEIENILSENSKAGQTSSSSSSLEEGELDSVQFSSPEIMKMPEMEKTSRKDRIWSPIRLARFVKRIRAVGRGRIEEIQYRIAFGFNKDDGDIMCKSKHDCNVDCARDFIRNINSDIMKMFNFRITEIERKTAQVEMLQFFDKHQPIISTCIRRSSALGRCHGINEECFGCIVDGKLEEIMETFKMLKVNNEIGFPTENVNWKVVGEDIDEIIFKIANDKTGEYPVNWMNFARVTRTFMLFLLNAELSTIQFQLIAENGLHEDDDMKILLGGFEKGKLFHTLNSIQKIITTRAPNNLGQIDQAVLIKNKTRLTRPAKTSDELFIVKGNQFVSSMNSRGSNQHGTIFYNEIQGDRFVILDPLLMKWTEKTKGDQIESVVEQLANMGVKVGRKMEIREDTIEQERNVEETMLGYSKVFWEDFEQNFDGTYGGDINATGAKFRAEPFHLLQPNNNRKLLPICLN